MIAEARVDELLDFVDKELKKIKRSRKLPGGAVIVGGTSKLPGIADFTREKLQLAGTDWHTSAFARTGGRRGRPILYYCYRANAAGYAAYARRRPPAAKGTPKPKALGMIEGLLKRFRSK